MLFAAVAYLDEALSLETLLILKAEKCLIRLIGTQRTRADFILENGIKK
jgi:hypothetical protein